MAKNLNITTVKLTLNGKEVEWSLQRIRKEAEQTALKMKGMEAGSKEWKEQFKRLETLHKAEQDLIPTLERVNHYMQEMGKTATTDIGKAIRELTKMRDAMPGDHKDLEQTNRIIEFFKSWQAQNKNLGMTFDKAKQQLNDLVNTPTDKLKNGLAAIQKELAGEAEGTQWSNKLREWEAKYRAQIAINEHGAIKAAPATGSLASEDRLRAEAERQRLVTAYQAASRSDDAAHKSWAAQALKEIQQYNSALQALTETERKDAQMKREQKAAADALAAANKTMTAIANNQKVTIQELVDAQKYYETELQKMDGLNLSQQDQQKVDMLKTNLETVKATLRDISEIEIRKVIDNIDDQKLETLEATLKRVKEDAAQFKLGQDTEIKDASDDIEKLTQAIEKFKDKMAGIDQLDFDHLENVPTENLEAALKRIEEQEKRLAGVDADTAQQMAANKTKIINQLNKNRQATIDYANAEKVAAERGKHSVTEMQAAYDALQQKLLSLRAEEHDAIRQTRQQMRMLKSDINEVKGEVTGLTKLWKTAVRNIATYVGVFAGFNMVKSKIMEIAKDSLALSDSMAQVQKVTGLASKEIDTLNYSLAKLDTRTTLTQLNDLAFSAGKMGLGKYGLEGVEGFVRATNQLQVALGDDLGNSVDEAITPLAKLAENLGLIQKMGVEKSMMAIGSSINELSQTTTAVGANIVDFARRIQPAAQMIGLTTDEILALGSASDAFGISSEISATSFTKFLAAYRTNTAEIERILGIAKGTLDQYFDQGRTIEGLMAIFQRMHDIGDLRYLEEAFKALGSEGSRMFTTFGAFSKNIDMFREHLQTSTKAFQEATSVTREFNLVQETAQGLMERSSNIWRNAFVNPEGVDAMKQFAQAWYDVSKAMTGNKAVMAEIKFLLAGIVELVKILTYLLPSLLGGLTALAFGRGLVGMRNALELTKLSAAGLTLSLNGLKAAWTALSAVGKANWIGLIATAVFAAIEAFGMFNKKVQEAGIYLKDFRRDLGDLNVEYGKGEAELRRYRRAIDEANAGSKQRAAAIAQFNSKFKPYLSNLLTEKSTALDVAKAYQEVCKQMRAKMALELEEKDREKYVKPREQWTVQRREEYDALVKGTSRSQYGGEWLTGYLDDAKAGGKSWKQIAQDLNNSVFHVAQSSFDAVMKQLNSGEFNELVTKTVSMGSGKKTVQEIMGPGAKQLWAAMRYVLQDLSTDNALQNVSKKYEPERKRINDYLASQDQQVEPVVIEPTQPDKGGSDKVPEWMKEEKEEAEKKTRAVIAAIEEFYRLQEAAANELAANGQLKGADFDLLIKHIQDRKDKMLYEARSAIVGDKNSWDDIKKTLDEDLINRDSEVSLEAIKRIQEAEPGKQGAALKKYNGSEEVFGLDSNAYLNEIRKNRAQNELNIQRRQAKMQEEIDKVLMQFQFVQQAQQEFGDDLVKLGLVSDGYAKVVQQLADGTEITANTNEVNTLATKVAGMSKQLYSINENDTAQLKSLIEAVMKDTDGKKEQFAQIFPDYDKWMDEPDKYKEKMQAFYFLMLNMEGKYYDAVKRSAELQKKRFEERWERSGRSEYWDKTETDVNRRAQRQSIYGRDTNFAQAWGWQGTIEGDANIEALENQIQKEKERMAMMKQTTSDKKLLADQQRVIDEAQLAYEKAVMDKMKERMELIQQSLEPIKEFGAAAGEALYKSVHDAEDAADAWRNALKQIIQTYGEMTIKIIEDQLKQALVLRQQHQEEEDAEQEHQDKMKQIRSQEGQDAFNDKKSWLAKIFSWTKKSHKQEEKETEKSEETKTDIAGEGGETLLNIGVTTANGLVQAKKQEADQTAAVEQQQNQTSLNGMIQKVTGDVLLGIAGGGAKTVEQLGWWGLPLVAVISAALMALLNYALSAIGGGGGDSSSAAAKPKIKLASGMLTYDEGNVQTVVGDDGRVYRAREQRSLPEGVSMVTEPIATRVNGQQALVGERGPEIVIGRKTTRAIQMNRPDLLRDLAMIDRGITTRKVRTFDEGNISDMATAFAGQLPATQQGQQGSEDSGQLSAEDARALTAAIGVFAQTVAAMQKNGIPAKIQKYGTGGLIDEVQSGLKFVSKYK